MDSIGDLYAPDGAVTNVVNAVVAYTNLVVNRPPYKHSEDNKSSPFLKVFPHGKIPAFHGKNGVTLFEGAAIARYFASISPESGLLPTSLEDLALVDQWCHLIESEMFDSCMMNMRNVRGMLGKSTKEVSEYFKSRELRALSTIETHLSSSDRTYPVGNQLTLADLTLAGCLKYAIVVTFAREEREKYPHVLKHFEMVKGLKEVEGVLGIGEERYAEESVKFEEA